MNSRFALAFSLSLSAALLPAGAVTSGNTGNAGAPSGPVAASQDAQNAIKNFRYDPGLTVSLWAAEPLLGNPVSFSVDEQGRWYIAESYRQERGIEDNRGHMDWLGEDIAARTVEERLAMMHKFYKDEAKFKEKFATYEDRITRVEDTTGSGKADHTTIIADGFRDPLDGTGAGILARGKDVWWTCIPNLWHFRVSEGMGKAESQEKLLSGFGVHFAFRGHDMHGLRFGPDGKLYFSIGDRGINVKTKEGKTVAVQDTGSIMRCNPDGTDFEVFATGVRNPQELAFDEWGNLFTGDNNSDSGDQARFTYLVEGGDCGWRMTFQYLTDRGPWNREKLWDQKEGLKAKYIIPPIANISNGPSGLTYNPGTGLSAKYRGHFFLSDFRGGAAASVVHEIALDPEGAFFKVKERRDFLKGCLTTDVDFGPDGALYVLDWVESWGGTGKGRIYRFTDPSDDGVTQAETKKFISEGMTQRAPDELGRLLAHPDARVRQAAQFELAGRGEAALPTLQAATEKGSTVLARVHGIWGLGQLAKDPAGKPVQLLTALLKDGEAEVRAQAARTLNDRRLVPAAELIPLLKDAAPRVRMYAGIGLSKTKTPDAVEPLFAMLAENGDRDPVLRHAAVMGLASCAKPEQLAAKAKDGDVAVRIGAIVALRRQESPEIAKFLQDADQSVVLEAARAIYDVPIAGAMPALAKLSARHDLTDTNTLLRVLNASYRLGKTENAVALAVYAANVGAPEAARRTALELLAAWPNPAPRDLLLNLHRELPARGPEDAVSAVAASIPSLLKDNPPAIQEAVARLAAKLEIQSAGDPLFNLATNPAANGAARLAAIDALATLKDPRLGQVARAAIGDKNGAIRVKGLQALTSSDPAGAVKLIAEVLNSNNPATEKQGALTALGAIKTPEASALLLNWVQRLESGTVQPEIQLDVLETARRANTVELNNALKKYDASLSSGDPLAPFRVALSGGDASRGRKVFREKAETQCLRCHKCEIGDSQVGPDLTHLGSRKDRAYILESIVYPNKQIAEGFETVVLTLKDKNVVVGRLAKSDANTLQVETMDEKGKPKSMAIPVAQVEARVSAPSPMPENIRDFLSKTELRDLVEYLATRK